MIAEAIEGSSNIQAVEEAAATDVVATTTMAVAEMETEVAEAATETSVQVEGSSNYHAGKEIIDDVLPSSRREAAAIESEEEENFNFCSDFFSPASHVGSSAIRSCDRVPHPKDIPTSGDIFYNERLEKVWWNCIDKMDGLKHPARVVSLFARTSMDVSF